MRIVIFRTTETGECSFKLNIIKFGSRILQRKIILLVMNFSSVCS